MNSRRNPSVWTVKPCITKSFQTYFGKCAEKRMKTFMKQPSMSGPRPIRKSVCQVKCILLHFVTRNRYLYFYIMMIKRSSIMGLQKSLAGVFHCKMSLSLSKIAFFVEFIYMKPDKAFQVASAWCLQSFYILQAQDNTEPTIILSSRLQRTWISVDISGIIFWEHCRLCGYSFHRCIN